MELLITIAVIFVIFKVISYFSRSSNKITQFTKDNSENQYTRTYTAEPTRTSFSRVNVSKKKIVQPLEIFPDGLEQDADFMKVFRYLEKSKEHIFVTGKAGTGKSTLLRYFQLKTKKKVVVLAPTGIAAINVQGQTIHSFFNLPHTLIQKKDIRRLRQEKRKIIEKIDTLIIDEVSMLRADILDGIDHALRVNREELEVPFGGVQLVFFGDLFQLPPIVDDEMDEVFSAKYSNPYFFQAQIFSKIKVKFIELEKVYRQTDKEFIALLDKVRNGECQEQDLGIFNKRFKKAAGEDHFITLTTTNAAAAEINEHKLAQLPSKEYQYHARISGDFDDKKIIAEYLLRLKKGAQVMMIKNDPEKRWVNGTLAEVHNVGHDSMQVNIDGMVCDVMRAKWEKIKYVYNEEEDTIDKEVVGTFEQFPLKLAWAITIHKSQGQTFDRVNIDLGNGAFSHGQLYVALSRCRTFEGITLRRPIILSDVIFDNRIINFREKFTRENLILRVLSCPSCNQRLRFPERNLTVTCPKCSYSFLYYSDSDKLRSIKEELQKKISYYKELYYKYKAPGITDKDYDALKKQLKFYQELNKD